MNVDYVPVADLTTAAEMIARQKEIRRRQENAALKLKADRASKSVVAIPSQPEATEAPPPPEGFEKDPDYIIAAVARAFNVRRWQVAGSMSPSAFRARRFAVNAIRLANPEMTTREIGEVLGGLHDTSVTRIIRQNERDGVPCPVDVYEVRADIEQFAARPSARKIIAKVADQFGVSVADIVGPSRSRPIIQARFAAVHEVATARPDLSMPALGREFGGRDHTTILHTLRKVKRDGVPQPNAIARLTVERAA